MLERGYLLPILGEGLPPENFDFGGISGGPMLTVVGGTLHSFALAGVIYQGPNTANDSNQAIPGLEVIRARRARFIHSDGSLDIALWQELT